MVTEWLYEVMPGFWASPWFYAASRLKALLRQHGSTVCSLAFLKRAQIARSKSDAHCLFGRLMVGREFMALRSGAQI